MKPEFGYVIEWPEGDLSDRRVRLINTEYINSILDSDWVFAELWWKTLSPIAERMMNADPQLRINQIKSMFGSLVFSYTASNEAYVPLWDKLIERAGRELYVSPRPQWNI